jgi:hypothetical protein
MERKLRNTLTALVVGYVCVAHVAMAADDGQTQPKVNIAATNSYSTPADVISTTNGSGNVKGVSCTLRADGSGNFSGARVKFTVNGGAVQTVDLHDFQGTYDDAGTLFAPTGWVPFNIRFSSSIRVQIQKTSSSGGELNCAVSWGLD